MPHIAVNGTLLNFELRGTGQPIVLLHGLGSSLRSWDAAVAHWRCRHTVLAYDARGHGLSSGAERMSLDDHVQDLKGLLECLGFAHVALIGTSMGSCIAQAFAIRYPEHVAQLVLAAPRCRGTSASATRLFEHAVQVRGLDDQAAHLSSPARARELTARLPHAACLEIPDAGHFPQWEQPDAFLDTVDAFLSEAGHGIRPPAPYPPGAGSI
jgi:3-oxoadipate enol-lactonase